LSFTYYSIATSVFYRTADLGLRLISHEDTAQDVYIKVIGGIAERIDCCSQTVPMATPTSSEEMETALEIRQEIWDAAIRYVAISLADRSLQVWDSLLSDGVKLTIHGKLGEIQFRPTNSAFLSMTAQHCVGGIKQVPSGVKVTYSYRLERESQGQIPVVFDHIDFDHNGLGDHPIAALVRSGQPICYLESSIADPKIALADYFTDV